MKKIYILTITAALLLMFSSFMMAQMSINGNVGINTGAGSVTTFGNVTFVSGYVITPRATPADHFQFLDGVTHTGASNASHVDGYVQKVGNDAFTFPIGDGTELGLLSISAPSSVSDVLKAAYYSDPPSNPVNLGAGVTAISALEYWDLDGTASVSATLHWDANSSIGTLVTSLASLRVVGYNGTQWVDLGNAATTGNTTSGTITSNAFIPNTYTQLTFAASCTTPNATTTTISAADVAIGSPATVAVTDGSLAVGTYTFTYNLSGANTATNQTASVTITAGADNFIIPAASLTVGGAQTVTITQITGPNPNICQATGLTIATTFNIVALPTTPTVNPLSGTDNTPIITGTYQQGTTLMVTVNGTTYTLGVDPELTSDGSGNWTLDLSSSTPLPYGTTNIMVKSTNGAGGMSTDNTTNEAFVNSPVPECQSDGPGSIAGFGCGATIATPFSSFTGFALSCGATTTVANGGVLAINGSLEVRAGNTLVIESGATVHVYGNIYNAGTITVNTGGTLYFYGDHWANAATAIVNGNNDGIITFFQPRPAPNATANSVIRPNGGDNGFPTETAAQCLDGGSITMVPRFELQNTANVNLAEITYTSAIDMTSLVTAGNNNSGFSSTVDFNSVTRVIAYDNNMIMTASGGFDQCGPNGYVVTNLTGTLTKQGLDNAQFLFPIGATLTDYAPSRITDGATAGANNYALRVQNARTVPTVVPDLTTPGEEEGPKRYWNLTTTSTEMDIALQHDPTTGAEGTTYAANPNTRYITHNVGTSPNGSGATFSLTNWDRAGSFGAETVGTLQCSGGTITGSLVSTRTFSGAGLSGWYSKTYDQLTPFGANAIALSPTVFLQGAFSGSSMTTTLNSSGILQASAVAQPYNILPLNYTGGETVGAGFFAANPTITDWVLVELRDATTPATVVSTRAAFVKNNGLVVDIDGTSPITFPASVIAGNYHIAIRHRNHLGIRTAAPQTFTTTATTSYDFTTAQSQAYQDGTITSNAAMVNLGGGKFGMWGGDANPDDQVYDGNDPDGDVQWILNNLLSGDPSLFLLNTYSIGDVNMDGQVYDGNDPDGDIQWLINNVLGAIPSNFTLRHFP